MNTIRLPLQRRPQLPCRWQYTSIDPIFEGQKVLPYFLPILFVHRRRFPYHWPLNTRRYQQYHYAKLKLWWHVCKHSFTYRILELSCNNSLVYSFLCFWNRCIRNMSNDLSKIHSNYFQSSRDHYQNPSFRVDRKNNWTLFHTFLYFLPRKLAQYVEDTSASNDI